MPPKMKGRTLRDRHSSRSKMAQLELAPIVPFVPHSTRLAPIPLERLKKYDHLKEMREEILKKVKLAHQTVLKGDLTGKTKNDPITFAIIVTTDDEVYTWGEDCDGMLGNGKIYENDNQIPRSIDAPETGEDVLHKVKELCGKGVVDIYASHYWSLLFAITKTGEVYSWGLNETYQLGHSLKRSIVNLPTIIRPIPQKIIKISTNDFQTYAITEDREVLTWGITLKRIPIRPYITKVLGPDGISGLKNIVNVVSGCAFVAALDDYGKVYYQRTPANLKHSTRMADMNVPKKVVQISAGFYHMLALTDDGKIIGWGNNTHNQLPTPFFSKKGSFVPKLMQGHFKSRKFTKVAAFAAMSVAELDSGGIYLWGDIFVNEKQVQRAPFLVQDCSNMDEVFEKYYPSPFPQPIRGEELPTEEEIAEQTAEQTGMVNAERTNSPKQNPEIITDEPLVEVGNNTDTGDNNASNPSMENSCESSSSSCSFVPIQSTSTSKITQKRKQSRSSKNIVIEIGEPSIESQSSDSSYSPEPTPKKVPKTSKVATKSLSGVCRRQKPTKNSQSNTAQNGERISNASDLPVPHQITPNSSNLSTSTSNQTRKLGNVVFKIGNERIQIRNLLLKYLPKVYPYFKQALDGNRSEVTISNITPAAFNAFVSFVEDDEVYLEKEDWENITSLMAFADMEGIEDKELKRKCQQLLGLDIGKAQEIYFACREKNLEDARKLVFNFILEYCKENKERAMLDLDLNRFRLFRQDLLILVEAIQ